MHLPPKRKWGAAMIIRFLSNCFFGLAALGVAVGFLGWWIPAGDSFALIRPVFAGLCLLGVFLLRPRWLRGVAGVAAVAGAVTVLPVFAGQSGPGDLRLYAKNLWSGNTQYRAVAADILAADVDVVMLQEVSERNNHILILLADTFPYQHVCERSAWMADAVLSRTPFDGVPQCSKGRAMALAPLRIDEETVWAASVHIPWPWPYDSASSEAEAASMLADLDAPVVIAGDFNMFPWTARVKRIAKAGDVALAGPARTTLTLWRMPMMIDHVLAPNGGQIKRRPLLGSDHHGLVADVRL